MGCTSLRVPRDSPAIPESPSVINIADSSDDELVPIRRHVLEQGRQLMQPTTRDAEQHVPCHTTLKLWHCLHITCSKSAGSMHCTAGHKRHPWAAFALYARGTRYLQVESNRNMHACLPCESHMHCRRRAVSIPSSEAVHGTISNAHRLRPWEDVLRSAATSGVLGGRAAAAQPAGSNDGALPPPSDSTDGRGRGGAAAASEAVTQAAGNMEEGQNPPGLAMAGSGGVTAQLWDSEEEGTEGQEGLPQPPRRRTNAVIASSSSEDELPLGLQRQPGSMGEAAGVGAPMPPSAHPLHAGTETIWPTEHGQHQ